MILHYPWGLFALIGVPVIIILYLLKQKREDYTISSLYLWQSALQDIEANSPWQKLKKNLLMFLQILAVILLALILSEPFLKTNKNREGDVLIVIDCSLSMQSTDIKPNRFEAAKKDAIKLAESYGLNTNFSVIVSGNIPHILLHQVNDKNKVIQEIKNLQTTDTAEDLEATIELVNSLRRDNPGIQVNWFGDSTNNNIGNGVDIYKRDTGIQSINYYSYNRNGVNYAVTLLSQRKMLNSGEITALSRIGNFSLQDAEIDVSLYVDGSFFDAKRVTISPGESENLYWSGIPGTVSKIECKIDTEDILEKDNNAGIIVSSDKIRRVLLVTERNVYLEKVLKLIPNLELYRTTLDDEGSSNMEDENGTANLKGFDLYIFDGTLPHQLPEDGHIIIFDPPGNQLFVSTEKSEHTEILTAEHELFDDLKGDISFSALETDLYDIPQWGNPILKNEKGIVAFEGYLDRNRIMVFGFDLHETNLPVKPFFPVIIARAVQEFLPGGIKGISSVYAGDNIDLSIDPEAEKVYVITPDGNKTLIAPPFPVTLYSETSQIGTYILEQNLKNETIQQEFIVNAPSEREFAISRSNFDTTVQENGEAGRAQKTLIGWDLKMLLLWILLAILMLEWWVYTNGITI